MATIKITIEQTEVVVTKQKQWNLLQAGGNYGYVEEVLPEVRRAVLLEQSLPSESFDLKSVIKALNGI